MLTTSILDLSEDEEEARRRGEPRKLGQIEDELRCRRTAEKNGISDILDDTKVAETEHMHERKMKQLEKEQAEEKKRMMALEREEEEKRRKKAKKLEEEKKRKREAMEEEEKQKQATMDDENAKRRMRIAKLEEDSRRRRLASEKEEDDERRRKIAKELKESKRREVEEEEFKLKKAEEIERKRKEKRDLEIQIEDIKKKSDKIENEVKAIISNPTIKITQLLDGVKEEKRMRNKTANIPIMPPQQPTPDSAVTTSSLVLSKYNLEAHSIVSNLHLTPHTSHLTPHTSLQVSPIDIEAWRERSNSINKEVLRFQEELLDYEEDSLNPVTGQPRPNPPVAKPPSSSKPLFTNGFVEKGNATEFNNICNLNEVPQKPAVSAKEKFFNSEPTELLQRSQLALNSDSTNNNKVKNDNDPNPTSMSQKDMANVAYADKQIEEYEKSLEKMAETVDEKIAEYEKGMREVEETKDPVLAQLDLPRKKSVHFEGVSICLSEVGARLTATWLVL